MSPNAAVICAHHATSTSTNGEGWVTPALAVAGVVVGSLLTGVLTWWNDRHTADSALQTEKYKQRLLAYQALWACTSSIRRAPDPSPLPRSSVVDVISRLDEWYFESGGLLLTERSRERYFNFMDELQVFLRSNNPSVPTADYVSIYTAASELRSQTASEVGGRSTTPMISRRH